MLKYRNKIRVINLVRHIKSNIITTLRGDVPTYIVKNVMKELNSGKELIYIPINGLTKGKSFEDYFNEYHGTNKTWDRLYLEVGCDFTLDRLKRKFWKYSDITVKPVIRGGKVSGILVSRTKRRKK